VTLDDLPRLAVVHVVVTDVFAGVERYVCQVGNALSARGHMVTTIGGDHERMRVELDSSIPNRPANTLIQAAHALIGERGADIVHLHMTSAEGAAWLARPWQRAPLVATRHFARDRGSSAPARLLARITSRSISQDVAISQYVVDRISGPSVLIPSGVPDQLQAELRSATVLMLQRLESEKAPDVGIRAWSASGLAADGWRLMIAGDGAMHSSLTTLVHDLGVADSVTFLGNVTDTGRLLAESSVLLAPGPEDSFGLSVVEAMAHGIPVVAARGGANLETVGNDGVLFAPGDGAAAAEALRRLSRDRSLRLRVGTGLRERQQRMFSVARHVERLEVLYRQVIDDPGRHTH
jgi:glycosyltransferase involved in cell wall biosynthesis